MKQDGVASNNVFDSHIAITDKVIFDYATKK